MKRQTTVKSLPQKPKKAKKAEVISEDDEDILIIPSDAYTLEDEDEERYEEE